MTSQITGSQLHIQLDKYLPSRYLLPEQPGYDEARHLYNAMIDRHPAAIIRPRIEAEIATCIALARELQVPLSVRCGGHNVAGRAMNDGGIVIDMRDFNRVEVDEQARTIRAGGGLTWGQFDQATVPHGLATVGGVVTTTGVTGLALGGGLGWLTHLHGAAVDNNLGARMVLADGSSVGVGPGQNEDLYWAIRGGGGNFGVVTELTFQGHPEVQGWGGVIVYPAELARDGLRLYRELLVDAPRQLHVNIGMRSLPDGTKVFGFAFFWWGDPAEGKQFARQMRSLGTPIRDSVAEMSYLEIQSMQDSANRWGLRQYWKSSFMNELSDDLIDIVADQLHRMPSRDSAIFLEPGGGALAAVPVDATAFPHRGHAFNLSAVGAWELPEDDAANIEWVRGFASAWQPWAANAVYVNYMSEDESDRIASDAYSGGTFNRLRTIKQKYDPENLFTHNLNLV